MIEESILIMSKVLNIWTLIYQHWIKTFLKTEVNWTLNKIEDHLVEKVGCLRQSKFFQEREKTSFWSQRIGKSKRLRLTSLWQSFTWNFPFVFQHVWQHLNKSGDQKIGTLHEKVGPEGENRFSICENFLGIKPTLFQEKIDSRRFQTGVIHDSMIIFYSGYRAIRLPNRGDLSVIFGAKI